jgi:agmatinase
MPTESLFQPAWNFLGLPEELAAPGRARAWILPIPYEGTTSYGAGTREGPQAIIAASRQVELFDREFDCEPAIEIGVHTMNPLGLEHRSPAAMVANIEHAVT